MPGHPLGLFDRLVQQVSSTAHQSSRKCHRSQCPSELKAAKATVILKTAIGGSPRKYTDDFRKIETETMQRADSLVSVVTPSTTVRSIGRGIESALAQSYGNWSTSVNNCGTPTLEIARLRGEGCQNHAHTNDHVLPVMQDHNHAVSFMSADSKYCKILQADDWLFPDCLQRMVDVAESSATVGVVGSYSLAGMWVRCDGLPYPSTVVPGRELCASTLRGELYPFWSPSSLLIRSDVVRKRRPFYSEQYTHGDVEAMYEVLQEWDFGFAHQVLTYIREHEGSVTSASSKPLNVHLWSNLAT